MAGTIASLRVLLGLDTSGMEKGAKRARSISASLSGTLAKLGVAVSGAFLAREAVAAFNTQEKAVAQLNAGIRSTGGAAKLSSREIQDYAAQLQKVTTFGDELTIGAASKLLTFTNIAGDAFKETLAFAQDLSVRMEQDLKSSVIQLGKALNDPAQGYAALKRAGVSFTQSQIDTMKAMQATGDVAGAQKIIFAELRKEVGGSAQAEAETMAGKWSQLANALSDLAEVVVGSLEPHLTKVAEAFKAIVEKAQGHVGTILKVARAWIEWRAAIFLVNAAMRVWIALTKEGTILQGITAALTKNWKGLAAAAAIAVTAHYGINAALAATQREATEAGKELDDVGDKHKQLDKLEQSTQGAARGHDVLTRAVKRNKQAYNQLNPVLAQVEGLIAQAGEELDMVGASEKQRRLFEAMKAGADDKQLERLSKVLDETERREKLLEQSNQRREELERQQNELYEQRDAVLGQLQTPLQEYRKEQEKLANLRFGGLISQQEYAAADLAALRSHAGGLGVDVEATADELWRALVDNARIAGAEIAALTPRGTLGPRDTGTGKAFSAEDIAEQIAMQNRHDMIPLLERQAREQKEQTRLFLRMVDELESDTASAVEVASILP